MPNTPSAPPLLGALLGGFFILVAGLAVLAVGSRRVTMGSPRSTYRAVAYALAYGLSTAAFSRVLQGALLGHERSPWLLALGDVIFIALSLFVWVMVLAEGYPMSAFGLRRMPAGRLLPTLLMGIGAVAVYSYGPYRAVTMYQVHSTADTLVFSLLWSTCGSALPEEILFRGYLMSSLDGRVSQWARVAFPALAFAAVRAVRFLPGHDLGVTEWLGYILGVALPLGVWWGVMRELAGGAIWPTLISHFLLEFGPTLAGTTPSPL
jgi:membrane protease YdiL (CAAX protease family)